MKIKIIQSSVKLASEELNIPEPLFILKDIYLLGNNEVPCTFNKNNNQLIYNQKCLYTASEIEIIITTFHEVRHAYQYYCIINKHNHPTQILEEWEANFDNYNSPTPTLNEDSDEKYLTQPIEKDAILWTHNIILKLFEIKTVLPKILKE